MTSQEIKKELFCMRKKEKLLKQVTSFEFGNFSVKLLQCDEYIKDNSDCENCRKSVIGTIE